MVRTRFAPSPTGYLHIGGVRTALFNYLFAKKYGGQFILRIDDTDANRNVEEALEPILDGFRWLGIAWDEGPGVDGPHAPYFQSHRADKYSAAVEKLLASGHAYRDYSKPEEYKDEREAAEKAKKPFRYSRTWMAETAEQQKQFEDEGRPGVVRLKMPTSGKLVIDDLVRGKVEFDWDKEQDSVIQRADGSCLYHLANVVDDHDFEITHVIRAEEHLSNTPRQIFIAEALGCELPKYAHVPYVAEPLSKNKLSKRKLDRYLKNGDFSKLNAAGQAIAQQLKLDVAADTFNPVIVDFYREIGFLPAAILNYLVLLGWSLDDRTEDFTLEQMIEHFSLERVNKAPASFDPLKLQAFQDRYMQQVPIKQKVPMVLSYLQRAGYIADPPACDVGPLLTQIVEAAADRIKVAGDILQFTEFFVGDDEFEYDEKAYQKRLVKPAQAAEILTNFTSVLKEVEPFDAATLETALKQFVEDQSIKIGDIIHALRVAVTGKAVGFGMFETLAILGRESCLARIDRTLKQLEQVK